MRVASHLDIGDPTRTRTWDPMVKSHLLYRLSYRTENDNFTVHNAKCKMAALIPDLYSNLLSRFL
jgi:hypothetical protein